MATAEPGPDGEDMLLGGRVRLRQPAAGYRVAIDPVLLAAAVPARAGEQVLDAGCGVGAAALCLARRVPGVSVTGIEADPDIAGLAAENARRNAMAESFRVVTGDIAAPPPALVPQSFDHVMANPPYMAAGRGNPPADGVRRRANVEDGAGVADWIAFAAAMVRRKGRITVIHRGDRLDEVLAAFAGAASGGITVLPLWPGRAGQPAKRVIVSARKGVATPLRLLPGLVLHEDGGAFTAAAEAVLRGGGALEFR